jgi:hypothetical protein
MRDVGRLTDLRRVWSHANLPPGARGGVLGDRQLALLRDADAVAQIEHLLARAELERSLAGGETLADAIGPRKRVGEPDPGVGGMRIEPRRGFAGGHLSAEIAAQ